MKKLLKFTLIGLLAGLALPAIAGVSFNTTNIIAANTTITSYPTNGLAATLTTNVFASVTNIGYPGILTGGKIGIQNYKEASISVQGVAGGNTVIGVTLVRSCAESPVITSIENDWDTILQPQFNVTVTGTSPFNWQTNLDMYSLAGANWIGVYTVTNGANAVSNLTVSLNGKIIPIRYP